jgi:hypothetical protein
VAIAHPPGRHALGVSALAPPQDLGGHPQQAQAFSSPLDGALGDSGGALELLVGGAGVAAGADVGGACERGRDENQGGFGDAARGHL